MFKNLEKSGKSQEILETKNACHSDKLNLRTNFRKKFYQKDKKLE